MKQVFSILFLFMLYYNNSFSQLETSEEIYNYFHGVVPSVTYLGQIGGLALPSE